MVVVCGPSDILHYRPHRYANSSLDKPTHGSFLRHYGMDFAVTPCHNHAYSYKNVQATETLRAYPLTLMAIALQ